MYLSAHAMVRTFEALRLQNTLTSPTCRTLHRQWTLALWSEHHGVSNHFGGQSAWWLSDKLTDARCRDERLDLSSHSNYGTAAPVIGAGQTVLREVKSRLGISLERTLHTFRGSPKRSGLRSGNSSYLRVHGERDIVIEYRIPDQGTERRPRTGTGSIPCRAPSCLVYGRDERGCWNEVVDSN